MQVQTPTFEDVPCLAKGIKKYMDYIMQESMYGYCDIEPFLKRNSLGLDQLMFRNLGEIVMMVKRIQDSAIQYGKGIFLQLEQLVMQYCDFDLFILEIVPLMDKNNMIQISPRMQQSFLQKSKMLNIMP